MESQHLDFMISIRFHGMQSGSFASFRTQTVILVDQNNMGYFYERTLTDFEAMQWTYSKFSFQL